MRPEDVKYHICPRCREQAIVLVGIKKNATFHRDAMGNIQYRCAHCHTIFSVDRSGKVIVIKLAVRRE